MHLDCWARVCLLVRAPYLLLPVSSLVGLLPSSTSLAAARRFVPATCPEMDSTVKSALSDSTSTWKLGASRRILISPVSLNRPSYGDGACVAREFVRQAMVVVPSAFSAQLSDMLEGKPTR